MRTLMVVVLGLAVAAAASAQDFIKQADQDARKKELMDFAAKLMGTPDTHERLKLLNTMVEKDVIRDAQGKPLGDGFAIDAFTWMLKEGQKQDDADARVLAVMGFESLTTVAARDALIDAMNSDPSPAVQLRAIQAIEKRGVIRAGRDLVIKLHATDIEIAAAAARCLATINYDPQNATTGAMIELMAEMQNRLSQAAADDPARADMQRLIQVLGLSVAKLVPTLAWNPGQTSDDLNQQIAKYTGWWNDRYLAGLKDPKLENRRAALAALMKSADRGSFSAILDATQKEIERLRGGEFPEKQLALQFVVDASRILARLSGVPGTEMRPTSTPDEMNTAAKIWQDWLAKQPK